MSTTIPQAVEDDGKRPINILSLDAGGPRGVSQLLILKDVMERLCKGENGDDQGTVKRPCEVFDMIGGVGTGGLIAVFLVVLKMTANEALDEFGNFVGEVFKDVARNPIKQTEKLTRTINGILERHGVAKDAKLMPTRHAASSRLIIPIMYKNHVGSPCILRNYILSHEPPVDITVFEAMLATCSTPPMFTPTKVSKDFAIFKYISGDFGLSNPTREIITEAHRAFGDERKVSCLLSIGCGHPGVNVVPSESGGTSWVDFLNGVARDSEKTAQDIATQMSKLTAYHRLSVNCGLEKNQGQGWMDLDMTTAHTTTYLNDLELTEVFNHCVDRITHGDGFTTLERLKYCGGEEVLPPPLPPLASNYVERTLPMEFLEKALFEEDRRIKPGPKIIVVTGIGGCGKTQLTRYFIDKCKDLFVSTFFVDGSSPDTIRRDIVRHVRALGGTCSQKSFEECMVFLSQAADGQRLLVIDNVDEPTLDLSPYLPRWQHGVVVITSRNHSRGQLSPPAHLQLDVMTLGEAVELLVRGLGQPWPPTESDRKLTTSVAEELACHPIALVQAISYMYNIGCLPGDYITLLRGNREHLRDHPATSQVDMRYRTAFAAFDASYNILPPKAQKLWHLLSFFRPQKFPLELITLAAQDAFSTEKYPFMTRGEEFDLAKECLKEILYNSNCWDSLELRSILAKLRSHSLITTISVENISLLQMHPLVHEWGRLRISEEDHSRFEAAAVRLLCCGASKDNYTMMQYLSSHVEGFSSSWNRLHANDAASLAFILSESGMYEKSAILDGITHEMVKRELGPDHLKTITTSANLAVAYARLGRDAEAEELQTEVLRRRKQLLGVEHWDTIQASANLAAIYHVLGRYAEAEELDTEVLRRRKQLLGVDHPGTIKASANLATTYHELGRYAEAEELYTEVLQRRKQLLGSDHPDTIRTSAGLASTYHELGRYAEAEELKTEVLRRRRQLLGVDHPDTIRTSAGLATTYYELGRYTEARKMCKEILRQSEWLLGKDHPATIKASSDLAATYFALERYAEGEVLYTQALEKRTTLLGERHPDTIRSMLYLAQTYNATQRQSEASPLAKKALRFALETLGESHPLSKRISTFLAFLPDATSARVTRRGAMCLTRNGPPERNESQSTS